MRIDPPPRSTALTVLSAAKHLSLVQKVAVGGTTLSFFLAVLIERYYLRVFNRSIRSMHTEDDAKVTFSVVRNFFQIARIALPTWRCREFFGSVIFILLFAARAVLRVSTSRANGQLLSTMLHGKQSSRLYRFAQRFLIRAAVGMATGVCDGAIEGIRPWLVGSYRVQLSKAFQRRYYEKLVFYQASVLDNRLVAADTAISTYCAEFAEHFGELPYYFVLPGMECITSIYALIMQSGVRATCLMTSIVTASVLLLRELSPQFGRIHSALLFRDDNYRRMLTNSISNVESIAMHGAGQYTRERLDKSLAILKQSLNHMALAKGNFVMLEDGFTTFLTLMANMVTFGGTRRSRFHRSVNDVYLEIQYINDLNLSVKNFVVNFRELSHLTEFAGKMAEFDDILKSIASGTFIHARGATSDGITANTENGEKLVYTKIQHMKHEASAKRFNLVEMDNILLKSPAGEMLFEHMNLTMTNEDDWVIVGENGCGKTSLLRMLCGLWLPTSGRLSMDEGVRYILAPQHAYMAPQCTLYEQLSFPHRPVEVTDRIKDFVRQAIDLAGAQTVVRIIGGYDSPTMGLNPKEVDMSYEWGSLSGGQKQRISMARVFFQVFCMDRNTVTPVAILDEATSMMDDTEQEVLNNLRRLNIRMISVTHREVVIRHHTKILRIKKGGKWSAENVPRPLKIGERATDAGNDTV